MHHRCFVLAVKGSGAACGRLAPTLTNKRRWSSLEVGRSSVEKEALGSIGFYRLLELDVRAELNPALLVLTAGNAEGWAIVDVAIRGIQIRMVEEVEDLNTEFRRDLLVDDREFMEGGVRLEEPRAAE